MNYFNPSRRSFMKSLAAGVALGAPVLSQAATRRQTPNIVVFFADDMGYADIGCFGAKNYSTPNFDRLAQEGIRFTDFYVAQPVCSASRTGLLTGCYPNRIGILGALNPNAKHGISDNEMTLAELVKQKNYATAIYGKWHLGHLPQFLPTRHGFDDYFGLPYSNDMWPKHPTSTFPPLPLIEGEKVIQEDPDQTQLTTWYTERAVEFIHKNKDRPFFLYVPHSMPHVPIFASDKYKDKTGAGLYADVIAELDWSMGQIMSTLRELGLEENTLLIFISDNGPWLSYGEHAGIAEPLREGKGTVWDGGVRVPCIMRWPEVIPEGKVSHEPAMTIDVFPTIANLVGAELPHHPIDGRDIRSLITAKPGAKSPHDALYFYWEDNLHAMRWGDWKFHLPHTYRSLSGRPGGREGKPAKYDQAKTQMALYNLIDDIAESKDLAEERPDLVVDLSRKALEFDRELKQNKRPAGMVS